MSSTIFRSPGVYTKETNFTGYSVSKNQIRKGRINRIFDIKNTEAIIAFPYGGGGGYVFSSNYDEMMKLFGGT